MNMYKEEDDYIWDAWTVTIAIVIAAVVVGFAFIASYF